MHVTRPHKTSAHRVEILEDWSRYVAKFSKSVNVPVATGASRNSGTIGRVACRSTRILDARRSQETPLQRLAYLLSAGQLARARARSDTCREFFPWLQSSAEHASTMLRLTALSLLLSAVTASPDFVRVPLHRRERDADPFGKTEPVSGMLRSSSSSKITLKNFMDTQVRMHCGLALGCVCSRFGKASFDARVSLPAARSCWT